MMPLTHFGDTSKHLVNFATQEDLDSARDVTPVADLVDTERARKRRCHATDNSANHGFVESSTEMFDEEKTRKLLQQIPADDRQVWIRAGMILKKEGGEEGRKLWDEWSEKSAKFNMQEQDRAWNSFKVPNDLGMGSLVYLAREHSPSEKMAVSDQSDQVSGLINQWILSRLDRARPSP
eukprot:COSAG04_NODE_1091_length_8331_cov_12.367954_4_plen_179_part_00